MATERFNLDEFKDAVPDAEELGMNMGEYCFRQKLAENRYAYIRSSIGFDGIAKDSGDDSIRLILVDEQNQAAGSRVDAYTTRIKGWQERLSAKIQFLADMVTAAGTCSVCGQPKKLFKTQKPGTNFGKWFSKCDEHNEFAWIDLERVKELADQKPVIRKEIKAELSEIRSLGKPDLSRLNTYQKTACTSFDGAYVMEAAPGSGKTRTIEMRVSNMLASGIDPSRIGCFTFSNKGAEEMRTRIARTLWPDITEEEIAFFRNPFKNETDLDEDWTSKDPIRTFLVKWVCTIHALSFRLLKQYGFKLKVPSSRQEMELADLIKDGISELKWDEAPKTVRSYIATAIVDMVQNRREAVNYYYELIVRHLGFPETSASNMTEMFGRYMAYMNRNGLCDFEMMQAMCLRELRTNSAFREMASKIFDYVIVDEAQDTSVEQFEILSYLAERSGNILCVGDVDQSMYAFRRAEPEVMRSVFEKTFTSHTRLTLPINYRSTQLIVQTSKKLITQNYIGIERYLKEFGWRDDAPFGDKPELVLTDSFSKLKDEAVSIVQGNGLPSDWFILSRTRAECAELHAALISAGIPAINKSGGQLFGSPHVRKVLAYASLACNYHDSRDDLDTLKEIANVSTVHFHAPLTRRRHLETCTNDKPWINCGCPTIIEEGDEKCMTRYYGARAIESAGSWFGVIQQTRERNRGGYPTLQSKGASDLVQFVDHLEQVSDKSRECLSIIIEECVKPWLAHEEGITDDDLAENGKVEDFDMLLRMTRDDQSMEQYLDEIYDLAGKSDVSNENESVLIGTIHWSKGAERPLVIANLTRCPIQRPDIQDNHLPLGKPADIEEERRLAYVAITRAKDRYFILHSKEWNGRDASPAIFESDIFSSVEMDIQDE